MLFFEGADILEEISQGIEDVRSVLPQELGGIKLSQFSDLAVRQMSAFQNGKTRLCW